jgi:hypothetical protein
VHLCCAEKKTFHSVVRVLPWVRLAVFPTDRIISECRQPQLSVRPLVTGRTSYDLALAAITFEKPQGQILRVFTNSLERGQASELLTFEVSEKRQGGASLGASGRRMIRDCEREPIGLGADSFSELNIRFPYKQRKNTEVNEKGGLHPVRHEIGGLLR